MEFKEPKLNLDVDKISKNACKGLFYRCRVNKFINNSGSYIEKIQFVPLKRKSCKGCRECGFLIEDLKEFVADDINPIIDEVIDGAIYKLVICHESRDWETGLIDEWELCFKKVKE